MQVHNNGIVALNNPPEHFLDEPFPLENYIFIAPFYGDVDTREAGTVWYTDPVTEDLDMLHRAKQDIHEAFNNYYDFSPLYLMVSTWDHVGYFKMGYDKVIQFMLSVLLI